MHSGPEVKDTFIKNSTMRFKFICFTVSSILFFSQCANDNRQAAESSAWVMPEAGTSVNLGDSVNLELKLNEKADSVVYFADGLKLKKASDEKSVAVPT